MCMSTRSYSTIRIEGTTTWRCETYLMIGVIILQRNSLCNLFPLQAEILEQCASGGFGGLHGPSMSAAGAVHLMNGLQHFNTGGGAAKRPHTMHKM